MFKDLNILTIDKLVVHRIGIAMYKTNIEMYPSVLNDMYKKHNDLHAHNTRTKDMFRISLGTQTFSNVSAKIWNVPFSKFDLNVSLYRFKKITERVSIEQYTNYKLS